MSWLILALLAPLLFAVVNILDDNLLAFVYKSPYLAASFAGFFGTLPVTTLLFFDFQSMPTNLAILATISGLLTVVYLYFYFKGLATESPAVVVAILGLAPTLLPVLGYFLLGERLTGLEVLGFVIVLLASLALAIPDLKDFKVSKAFVPLLAAVLFIDIVSISTKFVYDRASFYSAFMLYSMGMGLGGLFFYYLKRRDNKQTLRAIRNDIKMLLPIFIVAELTALAAEFTLNLAVDRGPVSLVKVIEGIQPMLVLLIALALHPFWPKYFREAKEGQLPKKFLLMVIIVIGLSLIGFASRA